MASTGKDTVKTIITYILVLVAVLGVIISMWRTNNQVAQARKDGREQQYTADKEIYAKLRVMENEIIDNSVTLKKLDTWDDHTTIEIARLKDSLVIFPTKEEVNAKFSNSNTTLKTDMMTVNSQMNNLNQRIAHLEGAWQLWIINFYRAPPVLTKSVETIPLHNTIYNAEMYK